MSSVSLHSMVSAGRASSKMNTSFAGGALLSEKEIWRIFADMARSVQHVHDKGFIHLDVKPSNFFVAKDRSVKAWRVAEMPNAGILAFLRRLLKPTKGLHVHKLWSVQIARAIFTLCRQHGRRVPHEGLKARSHLFVFARLPTSDVIDGKVLDDQVVARPDQARNDVWLGGREDAQPCQG